MLSFGNVTDLNDVLHPDQSLPGSDQVMLGVGQIHMPGVDLIPGEYRVDQVDWYFVKSQKTGHCYPVIDGEVIHDLKFSGIHEMMRERHPGYTPSGRPRGFSSPGMVRVLGVLLIKWRERGNCLL